MKSFWIVLVLIISFESNAQSSKSNFKKIDKSKSLIDETRTAKLELDPTLQEVRARSAESVRFALGTPLTTKGVGPALQAEWRRKLSQGQPVFVAATFGYFQETRLNSQGATRNFHNVPIGAQAGYMSFLTKNISLDLMAGPVYRQVFERGYTREQNETHSFFDLEMGLSGQYEWLNSITQQGRNVGLKYTRLFGLPTRAAAQPVDLIWGTFSFDL